MSLVTLCQTTHDSHNHLFINCEFSKKICGVLKKRMNAVNIPSEWKDVVHYIASLPCNKSIWSVVRILLLATIVYYRKESNDRMFNNGKKSAEVVIQSIIENIRLQLMGLNVKKLEAQKVVAIWNVQFQVKI